jgi:hypothetical protein
MLVACSSAPKEETTTDTATTLTETTVTTTETSTGTTTTPNRVPTITSVTLSPDPIHKGTPVTCEVDATDPDGDEIEFAYSWQVNGETVSEEEQLTGSAFERGDEVMCTATPSDNELTGEPMASNIATVGNAPPSGTSITVSPTNIYEDTAVTCIAGGSDLDGDPVTIAYAWLVNDEEVSTAEVLTGDDFDKHDTIICEATPSDPSGEGTPFSTALAPAVAKNTVPVVGAVSTYPDVLFEDTSVSCNFSVTDIDADPLSGNVDWIVNGSVVATGGNLTGDDFNRGDTVACAVTASDDEATGEMVSSTPTIVGNAAPSVDEVNISPAAVYTGTIVSCEAAVTDIDGDDLEIVYGWSVNTMMVATGPELSSSAFDKGDVLACVATVTDGDVTTSNVFSEAVTVRNSIPVATSVTVEPAVVYENQDADCAAEGYDADADPIMWQYTWQINASSLPFTTDSVLRAAEFVEGDDIRCSAYPSDDEEAGFSLSSAFEEVYEACYDVDNVRWLSDDFGSWDADQWSSQPDRYTYAGGSLLVSGDAGMDSIVPMRSNAALPIHKIEASLLKDDNCSDHFLMLSPYPDMTWNWTSSPDVLRIAWSCGFKYIYGPSEDSYANCSSNGVYDIEVELTEDGVVFRDNLCPDVTLPQDWTDQDLYVYIGGDQDNPTLTTDWRSLDVYQQPHFDDRFEAWDDAIWDSQPSRYAYSNDALLVSGGAESYAITPHMRTTEPLSVGSIDASLLRLENCDDHFIMLSASPVQDWNWYNTPDVVKFAWNCNLKTIYGQEESLLTDCPTLGTFDIQIDVDEDSLTFHDGTCDPVTVWDDIGEDELYVYVGGDQDSPLYSAVWLDLAVYPTHECAR